VVSPPIQLVTKLTNLPEANKPQARYNCAANQEIPFKIWSISMKHALPVVDDTLVWDNFLSLYKLPSVSVALELEIFESLDAEPDSAEGLAQRRGYDVRGLQALLPMLLQQGFLMHLEGRFHLNERARAYLLKASPYNWRALFSRIAQTLVQHKLLLETIDGSRAKAAKTRAADGWESGHVEMTMAREVTAYMHCHSMAAAVGMTHSYDFSRTHRMLDVGGGSGCFSIALAQHRSDVKCTVMELPTICELVKEYVSEGGVSAQVDTVVVDMFRQAWPQGYDTHFFSNIFHDWNPETCLDLAKRSFAALPSGGRILLHEMLLDDGRLTPPPAVTFTLLMAMGTLGQQFTFGQLRSILEEAGFRNVSTQQTYGYYSIVSGEK
jgi:predicted O-methyltransferase YrrM